MTPAAGVVYEAFGIRFGCPWRIPCPPPASEAPPEIEFVESPESFAGLAVDRSGGDPCRVRLAGGATFLRWSGYYEFLVPPGAEPGAPIRFARLENADPEVFAAYLLGQVLSFALLEAGKESFHATTVVDEARAIAFLGDRGFGKSTLGAAFLAAGRSILSDDLLVVEESGARVVAHPGIPRLKIARDTGRRLLDPSRFPPPAATPAKVVLPLEPPEFHAHPAVLAAIHLLDPRPAPSIRIEPLRGAEAFAGIVRNTFNSLVDDPARLAGQFRTVRRLVETVPIRTLAYPRDLDRLPEVVEAVRADASP